MTGVPPAADSGPDLDLPQALARLTADLAHAQRWAEDGDAIDLSGLETRVSNLCATILARPRETVRTLLEPLAELVAALDPLAAAINAQHTRFRDTIATDGRSDPHTARHRAAAAYGRGPTRQPSTLPDDSTANNSTGHDSTAFPLAPDEPT